MLPQTSRRVGKMMDSCQPVVSNHGLFLRQGLPVIVTSGFRYNPCRDWPLSCDLSRFPLKEQHLYKHIVHPMRLALITIHSSFKSFL